MAVWPGGRVLALYRIDGRLFFGEAERAGVSPDQAGRWLYEGMPAARRKAMPSLRKAIGQVRQAMFGGVKTVQRAQVGRIRIYYYARKVKRKPGIAYRADVFAQGDDKGWLRIEVFGMQREDFQRLLAGLSVK